MGGLVAVYTVAMATSEARRDRGGASFRRQGREVKGQREGQGLEGQFEKAGRSGRVDVGMQGGQTWQNEEERCGAT